MIFNVTYFTSVELIVLKVSQYVTQLVSCCILHAHLTLRLVNLGIRDCGLRTVISLAVVITCLIPFCREVYAWLMSRRAVGIRRIRSSVDGLGVRVIWIRYSVTINISNTLRCCKA